jgi:hypothetical protein
MRQDADQPEHADARNQTIMIGPNMRPIRPVPWRCSANNPTRITTTSGSTYGVIEGNGSFRPSSALSTEIAGVIAPSPYSKAAPSRPRAMTPARSRCRSPSRDNNARMPPSPSLSARMTRAAYLTDVVMSSVQTISDNMPRAPTASVPIAGVCTVGRGDRMAAVAMTEASRP